MINNVFFHDPSMQQESLCANRNLRHYILSSYLNQVETDTFLNQHNDIQHSDSNLWLTNVILQDRKLLYVYENTCRKCSD